MAGRKSGISKKRNKTMAGRKSEHSKKRNRTMGEQRETQNA